MPRLSTAGFAPAITDTATATGYLFLTGRAKEIINRGGEKISPREIDDVILGHPAVEQPWRLHCPTTGWVRRWELLLSCALGDSPRSGRIAGLCRSTSRRVQGSG